MNCGTKLFVTKQSMFVMYGDKTRAMSFTRQCRHISEVRWTTKPSCDVKLRQEFWCQKLLKSDNYSSTYSLQYEWVYCTLLCAFYSKNLVYLDFLSIYPEIHTQYITHDAHELGSESRKNKDSASLVTKGVSQLRCLHISRFAISLHAVRNENEHIARRQSTAAVGLHSEILTK